MDADGIARALQDAAALFRGHYLYESGHHGDLWLELDVLMRDPRQLHDWARRLATRAASTRPEVVCGPLVGGAFLAQLMAAELNAGFAFAERHVGTDGRPRYRIPSSLGPGLRGKRVLLVDDAVNAGSALLATLAELGECGARPVGAASLIALGDAAVRLEQRSGVPFFALAALERRMWQPEDCPLCRDGVPLGVSRP